MQNEEIIRINTERNERISAVYDPISGKGSTSVERESVEIEGFPIKNINIPIAMLQDENIASLINLGAEGYLHSIGHKKNDERSLIELWIRFCRERIKYDFEYWAKSTTIHYIGKRRRTRHTFYLEQSTTAILEDYGEFAPCRQTHRYNSLQSTSMGRLHLNATIHVMDSTCTSS